MAEQKHTADNTYTNQELLDIYREAYARAGKAGVAYVTMGDSVTRLSSDEIWRQIMRLEALIAGASGGPIRNRAKMG